MHSQKNGLRDERNHGATSGLYGEVQILNHICKGDRFLKHVFADISKD